MKSFAISAIIATVSAEAAFKCVKTDDWTDKSSESTITAATADTAACKDACAAIATNEDNVASDYCCTATTTIVEDGDNTIACTLWKAATGTDTIKTASADSDSTTTEAWAWTANELNADIGTGDDADSATMISSAIATIAAIAMVAY